MSIFEKMLANAKTREEILLLPNYDLETEECIKLKAKCMGLSFETVELMIQTRFQMSELSIKRGLTGIGISNELMVSV